MDKKTAFQALTVLSALSVLFSASDFFMNTPVFGLGADSWLIVAITLGVWALIVKQWS